MKTLGPALALSGELNHDAAMRTLKLRPNVKWHDGKPFGADDVVYTLRSWANPNSTAHDQVANRVNFNAVHNVGNLTVEVPLVSPAGQFLSVLTITRPWVIENGTSTIQRNWNPVGTGPVAFVSFTPGQQSVVSREPEYWQEGKPYVDKVVVNSSSADENARKNVLLSGAITSPRFCIRWWPRPSSHPAKRHSRARPPWCSTGVITCVAQEPYADNRVRQAMKLIVDRPALIDGALAGYGTGADDLLGEVLVRLTLRSRTLTR